MELPKELVTAFAKLTNTKPAKTEMTVYGTIAERDGKMYVKLDGSNVLTPAATTVDMSAGERVLVRVKNHTAIIIGNVSAPAAKNTELEKIPLATNSINYTDEGVVIADFMVDDITYNVLVNQNGVFIRNGTTILMKLASDMTELGNADEIVNLYGKAIYHYINGVMYKPYYTVGDVVTLEWYGAGFVSDSGTKVYFSIPLAKPSVGVAHASVASSAGLKVRQNSAFTHGSSNTAYASPSSYSATLTEDGGMVNVVATFASTTNAVNDAPCGITASISITFS